ncbi:DUF6891 domain-containing protein [Nocardiopsis chromatogenes]|uniref:DUF6891 domain-containing protein n=1 Tax=Nocardiopsis chromatogenes TaxID=280239 RepID=UPI000344C5FD|nr:hypothetical protein [Nocardiopsis chromatogenes]
MHDRLAGLDGGEVLGDLYGELATPVALAEGTFDEIVEDVIDGHLMIDLPLEVEAGEYEELEGVGREDLRAWLVDLLTREFAAHMAWQEALQGESDGDRLARAFAALNARAIVAREDFSCCRRCGLDEIRSEDHDGEGEARGYVFYHDQDTRRRPVYLAYDTPDGSDGSMTALGDEVVAVLTGHGLTVEWDRDPDVRIAVDADVRRVRTGESARFPGGGADAG